MMEYYSATKKNEMMPFAATWTDSESVMLSEISQTKKERHRMAALICGIQTEMTQTDLQNKRRLTDFESKCTVTGGGTVREFPNG